MEKASPFRRDPAIRCWIKHILEGKYSNEKRMLFSIFGKMKRVRFISTIIDKREMINNALESEDNLFDDSSDSDITIELYLDDGTGLIRSLLWNVDSEKYTQYKKGDMVDVVGRVKEWNSNININIEIIKLVEDPNLTLLRNAEIIQRIKSGDIEDITRVEEEIDDFLNEIELDESFVGDRPHDMAELKERIYLLIKNKSEEENGISFKDIKKKIDIPEEELKTYIKDLEMESKIYQAEENIYQAY